MCRSHSGIDGLELHFLLNELDELATASSGSLRTLAARAADVIKKQDREIEQLLETAHDLVRNIEAEIGQVL